MKKTYVKPEILFEDFTLSTNIAGDCGSPTKTPSSNQCGVEMTGFGYVFLVDITGCKDYQVPPELDGIQFDKICYDVPSSSNSLFNS